MPVLLATGEVVKARGMSTTASLRYIARAVAEEISEKESTEHPHSPVSFSHWCTQTSVNAHTASCASPR